MPTLNCINSEIPIELLRDDRELLLQEIGMGMGPVSAEEYLGFIVLARSLLEGGILWVYGSGNTEGDLYDHEVRIMPVKDTKFVEIAFGVPSKPPDIRGVFVDDWIELNDVTNEGVWLN